MAPGIMTAMDAEIIFSDPDDVNLAVAELIDADFTVEVLDWIDDDSRSVWITAQTITELDDGDFFYWVKRIVDPLGGWVVEAGHKHPEGARRHKCSPRRMMS
jgi:hypothetical protein